MSSLERRYDSEYFVFICMDLPIIYSPSSEFANSTILTIAHRLRTVIDYDRVMLLDQGRIVEYDSPGSLLSDPNSRFYSLCKATGRDEFAVLRRLAGAV